MNRDLLDRLQLARQRVARLAGRDLPAGLTEPDPGASERWDARQVWAHMGEFVGYWHAQLAAVVRDFDGMPVPFGRVKTDPGRAAAIELGRHRAAGELAADVDASIERLVGYLEALDETAWQARGLHSTAGVLDVAAIVDRFVASHLEEHADQLDGLG